MPRQPVVRHNDWSTLTPPVLGEWAPTLSVSVVIPTWRAGRTLPFVLAGLAAQSYPAHLLEVLVVDDGNEPAVELPEVRPEHTRVVRVETGWGRATACHTGAAAAEGDVLHWLDSDMLAYREHVEAQVRWHHLVDYAVVLGTKRFVDPTALLDRDPAEVRDAVAAGQADRLFDIEDSEPHTWVEGMWRRSHDLTTAGPRAFRAHVGATGSLRRAFYEEIGGMDTSLVLGEDMELGHRLQRAGGVLVPEHAAQSWHLGRSHVMESKDAVNRHNDTFLADLVPSMRPKRNVHGRTYQVPYLEVVVPSGPADATIRLVDSLLDGTVPDLRVVVVGPWSQLHRERVSPLADPVLETRLVHRSYVHEPRVRLVEEAPAETDAEFRLTLPDVSLAPLPATLAALLDDVERTHHGARLLTYPSGAVARLERLAALARVARLVAPGDDAEALLDEAFGLRTYDATETGFVPVEALLVERFVLTVRAPMEPAESERRLRKALRKAAGKVPAPELGVVPAPDEEPSHERRGLFTRRR